MSKMLAQTLRGTCLSYIRKAMLTLAVVMLLAVVVAADCTREIIWLGTSNYGGEQYNN